VSLALAQNARWKEIVMVPRMSLTRPRTAGRAGGRSPGTRSGATGGLALGLLAAALVLGCAAAARAWGMRPHSWITRAAVDALGPGHVLVRHLGPNADLLPAYCQMADWRRGLITHEGGQSFYADDYLLFPAMPVHLEHDSPDIARTYPPYFRRAVQALRTETPANAARWIGSLLHFVEDNGSPPHAFQTHGELHVRMETWVDQKQINLNGYHPQSLGATEDQALDGLLRRMAGLIAYSRERGRKLRPLAEASRRAAMEPIALESALECGRVVADLLETIGQFVPTETSNGATLRGGLVSKPAPGLESLPAKVVLQGTNYSTLADPSGTFELRNLPPGNYRMFVVRPGSQPVDLPLTLGAGKTEIEDVALPASDPPGNLVRNPEFRLHWIQPQAADHWYRVVKDGATSWESEPLPVEPGRHYRLVVRRKAGTHSGAQVLWSVSPANRIDFVARFVIDHNYGDRMNAEPSLGPDESERVFAAPAQARYAMIAFRGADPPHLVCESVALTAER
jgi:Carboxypeptidase regulatory-like domain